MEQRTIGHEIKTLSNLVKREISSNSVLDQEQGVTGMQGAIIGYLYHHGDREIFQRDIEQHFKIRRSTVTGILQLMEREGLICRQPVERDGRLKRLMLTDKAIEVNRRIEQYLDAVDAKVVRGISEEELEIFYSLVDRMKKNLEEPKKPSGEPE